MTGLSAAEFLDQEARALLTRLDGVRPFVVHETMVPAAAPAPVALAAVDGLLAGGRRALRSQVETFREWLAGPGRSVEASEQQQRFTVIRLAFNEVLGQFDLFTEVITQRSESRTGVWLAGLDVLAQDGLRLAGDLFEPPPVLCYLARGPGAAIRRSRTRLPGGAPNPVALIRIPRERMVGHGIASSLVHEVGHQGAALLCLVESLRTALLTEERRSPPQERPGWACWRQWISEIVADLWSVGKLAIGSTLGLIGVVSLPRWFVFRPSGADPHPIPWIRVLLSCAVGDAMYPDRQWGELADLWRALYPAESAPPSMREPLGRLASMIPGFVEVLLAHRAPELYGRRLGDVLESPGRRRAALLDRYAAWQDSPAELATAPPTLAFAVIGQARWAGLITPERESEVLGDLLTACAVRSTVHPSVLAAP